MASNFLDMLRAHPKLLVPLFITYGYLVAGCLLVFFIAVSEFQAIGVPAVTVLSLLLVFGASFSVIFAAMILYALLGQLERGEEVSVRGAFKRAVIDNFSQFLTAGFLLSVGFVIIYVIDSIVWSFLRGKSRPSLVTKTSVNLFRYMIKTKLRLIAFLTLAAIVWERRNLKDAVQRSFNIVEGELAKFLEQYAKTGRLSLILNLPPILLVLAAVFTDIELPIWLWFSLLPYLYCTLGLTLYYEQVVCGELLLWVQKKEEALAKTTPNAAGIPLPALFKGNVAAETILAQDFAASADGLTKG